MDPGLLAPGHNIGKKIRLKHTFPTGKGDTASGGLIEKRIRFDLGKKLLCCVRLSQDLSCVPGAVDGALSAQVAGLKRVGAKGRADTAIYAFAFIKHQLLLLPLTFGIVAPFAPQITPFEKNGSPYARAIDDRALLQVEEKRSIAIIHKNSLK